MENLKFNSYIEIFNPLKNNYFPVRILKNLGDHYVALILENNKEINIYEFQLVAYGYRNIWIDDKILIKLGFEKIGFEYRLNDLIIFETLIGDFKSITHPFYLFEFSSKHLGFAILKNGELKNFQADYEKINFNDKEHPIREKYFFSNYIDDVFSELNETTPDKFNYKLFDEILKSIE